jgi:uncharacterized membrane protein YqgA involved in biofilm formation
VNVATVLAGTGAGLLAGPRLPERLRTTVLQAVGLAVVALGVANATETRNLAFPLAAMVAGGIVGELARIEDGLEGLGEWLRRRLGVGVAADDGGDGDAGEREGGERSGRRFVEGFVSASLLFCVGPLTILGSLSDGLGRGAEQLLVKSVLDGTVSVVLASTLGIGVGLSALSVLVVQGAITLAAGQLAGVLDDRMIDELTATGGIIMLGIALRLLDIKPVRVGSFLPALVLCPLFVAAFAR